MKTLTIQECRQKDNGVYDKPHWSAAGTEDELAGKIGSELLDEVLAHQGKWIETDTDSDGAPIFHRIR